MFQVPLSMSGTCLSPASFWEAVSLYHSRPHLVNRKLAAASQILFHQVNFRCNEKDHISSLFTRSAILYELHKLENLSSEHITKQFVRNIMGGYNGKVELQDVFDKEFRNISSGVFISVRLLLPRMKVLERCLEIVILDKDENVAFFQAVAERCKLCLSPPFPYKIELTDKGYMRLSIENFEDADSLHAEWLADKLFPKLLKWSESVVDQTVVRSLSLIPADQYCMKYNELKNRYAERLVKEWPTKAVTDPRKYIFEDLAIASYLICLWKDTPKKDVNFVDCGCGNGLLVFVLNEEGYEGCGIDVRRREVWELYSDNTHLKVDAVTPDSHFTDANWIIGNHSDELTPWIPVIASRSAANFFLLPCCPYDFNGQKYARQNTAVSQYSDYLKYIEDICKKCGFETKVDKLRIPSTKRTCLVGTRPTPFSQELLESIEKFVDSRMSGKFEARSNKEIVRNCTQLDRNLVGNLIQKIVYILLEKQNFLTKSDGGKWNKGGSISLATLSRKINKEDLRNLKNQCGGLQTLLRNHRYLFQINNCEASLREPLKPSEETRKYKDKPCWFLRNHPDGCLYDGEHCAYLHS